MFQITFKILNWIRPYKARMILGFSMSFLNAIFIALPIFLAAKYLIMCYLINLFI
ncbi:ABC transporter ATP-binding protein [Staphylococcus aureus]|uniref:ABC transporter ATP-binding protein n=1 Tax=Staphylococcus aureus TaxID=1280 RepID=A0A380DQT1_STAAU|nr:ABC transporter ATP-binding protein [Staphylococcus aureus]